MPPLCLAVVKALYDYEPQSEDELAVKEDDLLYVIDNSDHEWWKVRHKTSSQEEEGPSGLVPSTYVEEAEPIAIVKASYDYEATADGELSVKENDILIAYDREQDWILVKGEQRGSKVGYVPATYVEDHNPDEAADAETPTRPVSNYVDPHERVLASVSRAAPDDIKTWPVTEIDAKGKKKKGTLGVGNGNVFFASESDKTPVQQWKVTDVSSVTEDKPKHVALVIGGARPATLHYSAGFKDVADAIISKVETSKVAAQPQSTASVFHDEEPEEERQLETSALPRKNGVHWAPSPTSPVGVSYPTPDPTEGEPATAMYDFEAQSEDELAVKEGDALVVLDRVSSEDWWKCRNEKGQEGVVPSSYVELETTEEAAAVAAADERALAEEAYSRAQAEADSEAAAAAAAERADREREEADERRRQQAAQKRRDDERRMAEQRRIKDDERARRRADEAKSLKASESRRPDEAERAQSSRRASRSDEARSSRTKQSDRPGTSERPKPTNTRIWHDRTGQFKVDAEFLGYANGKIKLHKANGVVIEVPSEKMSPEDMAFIEAILNPRRKSVPRNDSDDNVPLAAIADQKRQAEQRDKGSSRPSAAVSRQQTGKRSNFDWFDFFLNAGCDVDDCTRYTAAFERDKIDDTILADIKPETMRALGLREGDIIRVAKAIEERRFSTPKSSSKKDNSAVQEQLRRDEEYARALQNEINGTSSRSDSTSPAPNLFTGPGGVLKNNQRRGRPQTKSSAPISVDVSSIATASDHFTQSPAAASPSLIPSSSSSIPPAPVSKAAKSPAPAQSRFEDDAWEPRPVSRSVSASNPSTSTPSSAAVVASTQPSEQPAPAPPPAPAAPAAPPQAVAASQIQRPVTSNSVLSLAQTNEFDNIARLSQMRPPSAPITQMVTGAPPFASTPPPPSFHSGLGMGSSPMPLGQLQAQQTGMFFPQQQNGPRGPLAPIPTNQGLLNPLIPTNTGFAGFIPTRSSSTPAGPMPSLLQQPTGYPSMLAAQPTGMAFQHFGGQGIGNGLQPQPTSFNPTFQTPQQQPSYTPTFAGTPSFTAPAPSSPPVNHSPANIFAAMKTGAFAGATPQPQAADKYDVLRSPNGSNQSYTSFLTAQPTGFMPNGGNWNAPGMQGFGTGGQPPFNQTGYGGYQQR